MILHRVTRVPLLLSAIIVFPLTFSLAHAGYSFGVQLLVGLPVVFALHLCRVRAARRYHARRGAQR